MSATSTQSTQGNASNMRQQSSQKNSTLFWNHINTVNTNQHSINMLQHLSTLSSIASICFPKIVFLCLQCQHSQHKATQATCINRGLNCGHLVHLREWGHKKYLQIRSNLWAHIDIFTWPTQSEKLSVFEILRRGLFANSPLWHSWARSIWLWGPNSW